MTTEISKALYFSETRYEKLVSELLRIHRSLIFQRRLDGYVLKNIIFKDQFNVVMQFSNGEEKGDKDIELYHKQPLFIDYQNYDDNDYIYGEYNLSEEYQKEVIKDFADANQVSHMIAEDEYMKMIKEERKDRNALDGIYNVKLSKVEEQKEEEPF